MAETPETPRGNNRALALGAGLASLALGGAVSMTLMACYGLPPCDAADDKDNDGYCFAGDCDETNPNINQGADDPLGDNIDQNCDGVDGFAWDQTDAGDAGETTDASDAAACLSCAQAIGTVGTTQSQLCQGAALSAFQELTNCACVVSCTAVCSDNWCQATAMKAECQSCIDTQCSTAKLGCQEN